MDAHVWQCKKVGGVMDKGNVIVVYGIANCDTVKKAREWLGAKGVPVVWHDFKKQGVSEALLNAWLSAVGWEKLLNRRGTTWRKLTDAAQAAVVDLSSAKALMLSQPSVIRRPIVEWTTGLVTAGFSEEVFAQQVG